MIRPNGKLQLPYAIRCGDKEVSEMAGRNNRPKKNGPAGHPSHIEQYRDEFALDMDKVENGEDTTNKKDKTRYTM
ncbi:MAG: hypothetical protein K0Q59_3076 [Paenibacillus sp.]|jgi:hypothetical protein|nr:hypothetical protein [Paenibacillus sp.]